MSKSVAELTQERDACVTEAEKILDNIDEENRSMIDDEKTRYDAAVGRAAQLNADIEQRAKLEIVQAAPKFDPPAVKNAGDPNAPRPGAPVEPIDTAVVVPTDAGVRIEIPRSYSRLTAFGKNPKGELAAYRSGMWLRATLYGDTNAQTWCRQNGVGVRSALSSVNTAGGALVPEEFERAIIDLREEYGLFRRVCRVAPMGSDTRNFPRRVSGLTAYFVGEGIAGTESDAAWDNVQLNAKKLMCLTRMSSEIDEDAIVDLADQMAEEIAYAFATKEDECGFNGDGTSTYGGMVGVLVKAIDGNHTLANIAAPSATDTLPEIDADDCLSLMAAIASYAKTGAAWYCSPTALELVFNAIKIAGGGTTRDMLAQADTPRFLGYPINVTPLMADSASDVYNGLVMIAFGNLRMAATLGDRRGIRVALSGEQYWTEDQIGVKGTERFDINVHSLGDASVKPPFAVLTGTT